MKSTLAKFVVGAALVAGTAAAPTSGAFAASPAGNSTLHDTHGPPSAVPPDLLQPLHAMNTVIPDSSPTAWTAMAFARREIEDLLNP